MINPATLAFDIDGVFADIMTLFIDIASDEYNIDWIRYEDITCYSLADCIDIDHEVINAILTRILDGTYRVTLKPIEGAVEVLARIGRYVQPILFVTARPYPGPIYDWIQNVLPHGPASIEVITTGSPESKADVLLDRDISYFVEDSLDTCFFLQDVGIIPVLFRQPWNREPHPFIEVGTWKEIESLIQFDGL